MYVFILYFTRGGGIGKGQKHLSSFRRENVREVSTGKIHSLRWTYFMVSAWSFLEPVLIGGYCSVHFNVWVNVLLCGACRNHKT